MKRISTDAEYLDSGRVTIDADGIPVELGCRGTGSPEGKVAAPVGSVYTDTEATNGAIRWVKSSDTGNTGWVVEYGDTGWRNISADTTSTNQQGVLRRVGKTVYLTFLTAKFDTTTGTTIYSLPTGFRPGRDTYFETVPYWSGDTRRSGRARFGGEVEIRPLTSEDTITFNTSWPTNNPWPTTLPGIPK